MVTKIRRLSSKLKPELWLPVGLLAVAVVVVLLLLGGHVIHRQTTYYGNKKPACELFNPIDAYTLMGAVKQQKQPAKQQDDQRITQCSYTSTGKLTATTPVTSQPTTFEYKGRQYSTQGLTPAQAGAGPQQAAAGLTARVVVLTPLSKQAVQDNQKAFQAKGSAAVKGYGDAAYWDAKAGELNVLKHNTWYKVSYGPQQGPHSLNQTKKLADLLKAHF